MREMAPKPGRRAPPRLTARTLSYPYDARHSLFIGIDVSDLSEIASAGDMLRIPNESRSV
jgi:hypothetical protein